MPRCAHEGCERWRPAVSILGWRWGLPFDEQWYCGAACLEAATRTRLEQVDSRPSQPAPGMRKARVGTLLLHQHAVSAEALERGLAAQLTSGRKLGEQLLDMGSVSAGDLLKALAAQAGVAYLASIDTERVLSGPGGLSPHAVRALRLVPFEANATTQRLKVACAAPLPRPELNALRMLSGWAVDPFLVTDEQWRRLSDAYGATRTAPADSHPAPLRTITDATARIVRAARTGRAQRMSHAPCGGFVWVRLEGRGQPEDLLLARDETHKEQPWPVEHMSL